MKISINGLIKIIFPIKRYTVLDIQQMCDDTGIDVNLIRGAVESHNNVSNYICRFTEWWHKGIKIQDLF